MDLSVLEDIGLTNAEIKVYLALLELGTATAGPVLRKTGLQNSVVHLTLGKLVGKGFVSYTIKGRTRQYQAMDPSVFLTYIEERKQQFEMLLPELKMRQGAHVDHHVEIYEGLQGLKNCLYDMIDDAKHGEEYLFFSFDPPDPGKFDMLWDFYEEFAKYRVEKGLDLKGVAPKELKDKMPGRAEIRWVDFPIMRSTTVFRDFVVINPWEEGNLVTYFIRSKQFATFLRRLFYDAYEKGSRD